MIQNEPIAQLRNVPLFLVGSNAIGVGSIVFAAGDAKIRKSGGAWVNSTNLPVETIAGGGTAGSYRLQLTQAEVDTAGEFGFQITNAAIRSFVDAVEIEPDNSQRYFQAQAGSASGITLDAAASAINDFYASATAPSIVLIIAGTGAGQARKANAYNGTTKVVSVTPNWITAPDATSVARVLSDFESSVPPTAAIATAIWTYVIEAGYTSEQMMRLFAAVLMNKATSLEGATPVYRDLADTKDRVVAAYSAGNRTPSTRDGT